MFKIPAALPNVPTAWKGHWYGREGESLGALSPEELGRLRGQARRDWSKQLIEDSGIQHLDADAIRVAREQFKKQRLRNTVSAQEKYPKTDQNKQPIAHETKSRHN
jgi:ATP-dependent DNA helicase RecG